jgi:hypothetical protein
MCGPLAHFADQSFGVDHEAPLSINQPIDSVMKQGDD